METDCHHCNGRAGHGGAGPLPPGAAPAEGVDSKGAPLRSHAARRVGLGICPAQPGYMDRGGFGSAGRHSSDPVSHHPNAGAAIPGAFPAGKFFRHPHCAGEDQNHHQDPLRGGGGHRGDCAAGPGSSPPPSQPYPQQDPHGPECPARDRDLGPVPDRHPGVLVPASACRPGRPDHAGRRGGRIGCWSRLRSAEHRQQPHQRDIHSLRAADQGGGPHRGRGGSRARGAHCGPGHHGANQRQHRLHHSELQLYLLQRDQLEPRGPEGAIQGPGSGSLRHRRASGGTAPFGGRKGK